MKLTSLLQKHFDTQQAGLSNNLGDGYLVTNNSVYRTIRKKSQELKFTFTDKPNPEYIALPMSQLENILSSKAIPYSNNVDVLKKLNEKIPGQIEWDHVVDNIKPNYVFHESCHVVARHLVEQLKLKDTSDIKTKITVMLLEESFANTCEFMATADASDETHRLFLEVNSYFTVFDDRTHLKNAMRDLGFSVVFKFMLMSYLHSNFLNEKLSEKTPNKTLKSLGKNAFALNPRFRFTTTELYLRLHGIKQPVTEALKFDYLAVIEHNPSLQNLIQTMELA